jgi:hypothetical protein
MKTEHAGAKNGRGRSQRRLDDKALVKSGMEDCPDCPDPGVHLVEAVFERELKANNCYVPPRVLRLLADIAYHSLGVRLPLPIAEIEG